ncbi:MAG: hypothetical protein HGA45_13315 [Chloroflexales bacterium]|nr:hypothetical protein [Chloroflexales bacterium]
MDLTAVTIIFVAGLIALGLTFWMLNRAWGDFPSRAGPQSGLPPTPLSPRPAPLGTAAPADDNRGVAADDLAPAALPPGTPADGLVLVAHPAVRRAVEQAMERAGSPYATFFIRDGERIYLALYRIADPAQRETARRVFEGLNSGNLNKVGLAEVISMIGQIGK